MSKLHGYVSMMDIDRMQIGVGGLSPGLVMECQCGVVMGYPYSLVKTSCANNGRIYKIPVPKPIP